MIMALTVHIFIHIFLHISSSSGSCTHAHKAPVLQPEERLPLRRSQISRWIKIWQTLFHLSRTLPGSLCQTGYSNSLQWGLSLWSWNWGDLQGKHKVSRNNTMSCKFFKACRLKDSAWILLKDIFCVHSYQDQSGEHGEEYETEEQLQVRILNAALEFVPLHGWSVEAIASGAEVSTCKVYSETYDNWDTFLCNYTHRVFTILKWFQVFPDWLLFGVFKINE